MLSPNNIELFYAEEETSERVWATDAFFNRIHFLAVRALAFGAVCGLAFHIKQLHDARKYAREISGKVYKEGGEAILGKDNSVTILMDGQIQEIIQADDRRLLGGSEGGLAKNDSPR